MSWVPAPSSYLRRDPTMAPRNLAPCPVLGDAEPVDLASFWAPRPPIDLRR